VVSSNSHATVSLLLMLIFRAFHPFGIPRDVSVFHHGVHGAASASMVGWRSVTRRPRSRLWPLNIRSLMPYATDSPDIEGTNRAS
jgi:hypothetical protein